MCVARTEGVAYADFAALEKALTTLCLAFPSRPILFDLSSQRREAPCPAKGEKEPKARGLRGLREDRRAKASSSRLRAATASPRVTVHHVADERGR